MAEEPKVCIDRSIRPNELYESAGRAIEENSANVPVARFRPLLGVMRPLPQELAVLAGKRWQNGRTLRVSFVDGEDSVQAKVEEYAHQWSDFGNIKFDFGSDPDAEIRISFQERGSWSYLGTDALSIPESEPTMNYGWLTPDSSEDEYSRVVIHEFGHALGCIHEHQNPAGNIPWDKEAVYNYYMGPPNNWTKQQVDHNLFEKYDADITNFSELDSSSIMLYPIPNQFTIGDFEVGWNTELSDTDTQFIATQYPGVEPAVVELPIDGTPVEASIGNHGEEDLFQFAATNGGKYVVETEGPTDVVMVLLGPDDETHLVAEDDDSGAGYNAKISADLLDDGTYFVRVRHYRSSGTGGYRISVRGE